MSANFICIFVCEIKISIRIERLLVTYVSIELPHKAGEVAVLEECRKQVSRKLCRLPHYKTRPVFVPRNHFIGGRILHQHVRFQQKRWRRGFPHIF